MKKLLLILLCLPLLFTTCKKEDEDSDNSPFVGLWSGTYAGDTTLSNDSANDASGIWNATISSNGEINGTSSSVDVPDGILLTGTVTNGGDFNATIGEDSLAINLIGELNGNYGSGTWNSLYGFTGTWEGYNYNQ